MALSTAGHGPVEAVVRARDFELQPPLYFVLLSVWRFLSGSVFWARMLSVVAVAGAILVAGRQLLPSDGSTHRAPSPKRLLALLLATSPIALWAAAEARVYGLTVFLGISWVCLFWREFLTPLPAEGEGRRVGAAGVVVLSSLLLATQYYTGFLLLAGAPAVLAARGWRHLARYAGLMLVVGIVVSPLLVNVPEQMRLHGADPAPGADTASPAAAFAFAVHRVETLVLPPMEAVGRVLPPGLPRRAGVWGVRFALVVLLGLALRQAWRVRSRELAGLLLLPAALVLLFMLLRFRIPDHLLAERHLIILVPPSLAALAVILSAAAPWVRRSALALLVAGGLGVSAVQWAPLAKTGYARDVAEVLDREASVGDVILVYRSSLAAALALEYHGPARLVPLPRPLEMRRADLGSGSGQSLADTAALAARMDSALAHANGAWLVLELAPQEVFGRVYFDRFERLIRRRFRPSPPVATFPGVQVRHLSGR
ncbi:MAG TPA: hypothetical protein VFS94_08685 [Gemmatimonadales bacterium]|nr:hypothetical protein [Gemmatimonadales bacterium]